MVFDGDRDGNLVSIDVDQSVTHILVHEETNTAVLGWRDADLFGLLDLEGETNSLIEHPGMWDIDSSENAELIASVSSPIATTGSVELVDNEGAVLWESNFDDATGFTVAITDEGEYVTIGTARYWGGGIEPTGQPGIRLYDNSGTNLWRYDHDENVISIGISSEHELVVAGTDDGTLIVLDIDGNVLWETTEYGGWVVLSNDGETILTSEPDGMLYAIDSRNGDQRWETDLGMWVDEDISVSDDGSRAFVADRGEAEFAVIDEGETIWTESHDIGPGLGSMAGNKSAWSTIVTDLDEESSHVYTYRDPEAVAEPTSSIGEERTSSGEDEPSQDSDESTDTDDSSEGRDGSADGDDETIDESGESTDADTSSVSLELVGYHILGNDANEEQITLRNTSDGTVDASYWRIEDAHMVPAQNLSPYEFPRGFTLERGAEVTIVTGEGENTPDRLYWGKDRHVWNEEGDVVYVRDGEGEIILEQPIAADPNQEAEDQDNPLDGPVTVAINQTNSPVTGGDQLRVEATLSNGSSARMATTVELVVGDEVVDSRQETILGDETQRIELGYTTYPVEQDVSFGITVRTGDDSASTTVEVLSSRDETGDESEPEQDTEAEDPDSEANNPDESEDESESEEAAEPAEDEPEEPTEGNDEADEETGNNEDTNTSNSTEEE
ncbi:PQQ-binding-like beta-propeller repeat protein [Saliphagus sp. GCM10025308]